MTPFNKRGSKDSSGPQKRINVPGGREKKGGEKTKTRGGHHSPIREENALDLKPRPKMGQKRITDIKG